MTMQRLIDPQYMAFPFRLAQNGVQTCRRAQHVRQIVEQVLFTNPNERPFRLSYGAGVRRIVFEPNAAILWDLAKQRLLSNLGEVMRGEVDPASLSVEVDNGSGNTTGDDGVLTIRISYRLATINREESVVIPLAGGFYG